MWARDYIRCQGVASRRGDPKGFGRFLLVSLLKPRGLKRGQTLHFFLRVFSGEEMTKGLSLTSSAWLFGSAQKRQLNHR